MRIAPAVAAVSTANVSSSAQADGSGAVDEAGDAVLTDPSS